MTPHEGDPPPKPEAGVDLAADRRRAGRPQVISPQLVPLLRGQLDPDAPADPDVGKPGYLQSDRQKLALGAAVTLALLLVGAVLRFGV